MGTRRLGVFLLLVAACAVHAQEPIRVGSKRFTESYILGEILAQTARGQHKAGLGNTAILVAALENDAIDVYPEYTGTIINEILRTEERLQLAEINRRLARLGLAASTPLGFSNSYALGTRRDLRAISDLTRLPELRLGFSHEFLGRRDGWPGLKAAYGLPQLPRGLDHGLAYEALAAGEIDVMDLYSTDAKIERYRIAVLADDRGYFPAYDAVLLARAAGARADRTGADDPVACPARVPDPADRQDRAVAGPDRVVPVCASADHAQHARRTRASAARAAPGGNGARPVVKGYSLQDRAAACARDHHGGRQDLGGDQRRHRDHRRLHRRRRVRRAHRAGPGAERPHRAPRRCAAGGGARSCSARGIRARRALPRAQAAVKFRPTSLGEAFM